MLRCIRAAPSLKGSYLLLRFPVLSLVPFSTFTPKLSVFDYLVNRHHFSPNSAANASASLRTKFIHNPQNADSVLYFFAELRLSKPQIVALVQKSPRVLSARLESSIRPKFKVVQDLGFRPSDAVELFSANPWLLKSSSSRLRQSVLRLKNVLGHHVDICELLKKSGYGRILANNTVVANIEYLKSCGICPFQITTYACSYLRLYRSSTEKLKGCVKRVDVLGVPRDSKMFLHAIKVIASMTRQNWELKLKLFRDLGFSERNILQAFRMQPAVFALSERKVKVATQILLSLADISYVAKKPYLLTYSVEKRLKPRLRVLKALDGKNLLKRRPTLASLLQMTDAKFIDFYVSPYSQEVRDVYEARNSSHLFRYAEKLRSCVKRVEELGVPRESKMFLYAIKVICSMTRKNLELKLKLFRYLVCSEHNITHAFRMAPNVFTLSERKVKEATRVLLNVTDISYVAKNPQLLNYSVEKRLKPRLRVLKALERKNLLKRRPILTSFLQMTDAKFIDMYVSPYFEVGDLYVGK